MPPRTLVLVVLLLPASCSAQGDPEDFRVELTAGFWRHDARGELQSGVLPIDLRRDLALEDRFTFQGRFVLKPARRHRIFIEGSPYSLEGTSTLTRTIVFEGRTYMFQDTIESNADLTYLAGGYQFDLVSGGRGHFGLQVSGAYFDASGTIRSLGAGFTATRSQQIGLPLAGAEFRAFLIPRSRLLNVNGQVKGMALGDYGRFLQADGHLGLTFGPITLQAGYGVLDADVHERGGERGIAPRFRGPIFSIQFRR